MKFWVNNIGELKIAMEEFEHFALDDFSENYEESDENISEDASLQEDYIEDTAYLYDSTRSQIIVEENEKSEIYVAGENLIIYKFPKHGIKLSSLHSSDINKNRSVFISPKSYTSLLKKIRENRFVILQGEPNIGKYFTSIHISDELIKKLDLSIQIVRFNEDAIFSDFLEEKDKPQKSIYIIQDSFIVPGLNVVEVQRHYSQIKDLLESSDSYAIFTTDCGVVDLANVPDNFVFSIEKLRDENLVKILDKHLIFYGVSEERRDLIIKSGIQIVRELQNATNVDRFVQRIISIDDFNEKTIDQVLDGIANVRKEFTKWFNLLDLNERYYIMLAKLCQGLEKDYLWDLYEKIIKMLQVHKVELKSPLNYTEDGMWRKLGIRETEIGSLGFENQIYSDLLLEQIHNVYRHQFIVLLPVFNKWIVEHKNQYSTNDRFARITIAGAVGEISKHEWRQIIPILDEWATSNSSIVRASVAHVLRRKSGDINQRDDVLFLLDKWKEGTDLKIKWTVAACCERLFPYMPEQMLSVLLNLSKEKSKFVRKAIIHALDSIARSDIDAVFDWIYKGLVNPDILIQSTSAEVFSVLSIENKYFSQQVQDITKFSELQPILRELSSHPWDELLSVMNIFKKWISEDSSDINKLIENIILTNYQKGSLDLKKAILTYIQNWMDPENIILFKFSSNLHEVIQQIPMPAPNDGEENTDFDDQPNNEISSKTFIVHQETKLFRIGR